MKTEWSHELSLQVDKPADTHQKECTPESIVKEREARAKAATEKQDALAKQQAAKQAAAGRDEAAAARAAGEAHAQNVKAQAADDLAAALHQQTLGVEVATAARDAARAKFAEWDGQRQEG